MLWNYLHKNPSLRALYIVLPQVEGREGEEKWGEGGGGEGAEGRGGLGRGGGRGENGVISTKPPIMGPNSQHRPGTKVVKGQGVTSSTIYDNLRSGDARGAQNLTFTVLRVLLTLYFSIHFFTAKGPYAMIEKALSNS